MAAQAVLPDFHGFLVVRTEEAVGAVLLHGLTAVLAHVEHCGWKERTELTTRKGAPHHWEDCLQQGHQTNTQTWTRFC